MILWKLQLETCAPISLWIYYLCAVNHIYMLYNILIKPTYFFVIISDYWCSVWSSYRGTPTHLQTSAVLPCMSAMLYYCSVYGRRQDQSHLLNQNLKLKNCTRGREIIFCSCLCRSWIFSLLFWHICEIFGHKLDLLWTREGKNLGHWDVMRFRILKINLDWIS